ncbi:cyclophilin-like fold protein [Succinatimonas hippei]|uniref:cyclophilin-like fold protein n=1 Tax=Succinatimonas hippei TaxID=626938 RepID=UPI0023F82A0C|nr:cyclophilin-like fold protein [Succinatimonas hippei]MDM8119864.1 cyclophilin-like fold protein [Succinatimonas hippei]
MSFINSSLKLSLIFACGTWGSIAMAQDVIMTINDTEYVVTVDENTAAGKLFLEVLPLSLNFENFGSNERIAYLPHKLDMNSYEEPISVKRGGMTYYVPWGNLAVFRKSFSCSADLAPLGAMSEEAISALEKSGSADVSFKLK